MQRAKLLAIPALLISASFLLSSQVLAEVCGKHLTSTCDSCHSNAVACGQLGKSSKEWQDILAQMRSNGAAFSKKEAAAMAECMSQPSAAAKAACQKK